MIADISAKEPDSSRSPMPTMALNSLSDYAISKITVMPFDGFGPSDARAFNSTATPAETPALRAFLNSDLEYLRRQAQ
jgi:hypothetical protein